MLESRYGRFIDGGTAYEVTDPATPMPWVNVISNGRYGMVVSQNAGGFSFLDHCQLNVITRWDMDLARDERGKHLYLADLDRLEAGGASQPGGARAVWSIATRPCRPAFDRYRCVHRPGSTLIESEFDGVAAAWELTLAPEDPVEIWRVTLTNASGRTRRLRIGSFFEWCCGAAPDIKREFHRLFFTVREDRERNAIIATKNMWEAPFGTKDDHWNRPWPHAAAHALVGAGDAEAWLIADKRRFLGRRGDDAAPEAMLVEHAVSGGFGRFNDACAAAGCDLEIPAGVSVRLAYLTAVGDGVADVQAILDRYRTPEAVDAAAAAFDASWRSRLSRSTVRTERDDVNVLANTWLPYQAISGRLWGRTGYYQQSGAYGFRDQLQDSQVWLPIDPDGCRSHLLLAAAHQFTGGDVYHWWNPITETGHRTACSDDYLWLPFVTASYLRETGDWSVLDETAPFVDAPQRRETLREHCRLAIERSLARFGPQGLPLIGDMDWNDGLSAVGDEHNGESVWMAFFLRGVLADWAWIMERAGDPATAAGWLERADALREAVNAVAWDGDWYRRATKIDGSWIGDRENEAGQIFLNAQTWAILSDSAPPDRAARAWRSAKERLLTPYGPLLLAPAYTEPDPTVGYITRYAPGARENGGVYMHAATWALLCACRLHDREAVAQILNAISPPLRGRDADAYHAEPYVAPGNVDGPLSDLPGRAGWTWYTGSAAWLHRVIGEHVLGVRPTWEGLQIDPCPPADLGKVEFVRQYRGRAVRVRFDARAYAAGSRPRLTLDGRPLESNVIPPDLLPPGGESVVEVAWAPADARAPEIVIPRGVSARAHGAQP